MAQQPFLELKDKGAAVEDLQTRLKKLGFDPGPLDGVFGERTEDAVRDFQVAHHLTVDGQVGPKTWAAIAKAEKGGGEKTPPQTVFAGRLARVAEEQWKKYHSFTETSTTLSRQIKKYWDAHHLGFTSVEVAWSAAFISWCAGEAGATSKEFLFSARHSAFVQRAIRNRDRHEGVFHGMPYNASPLRVGDILQNNRNGNRFGFAYARARGVYDSHSAVVVRVVHDGARSFAVTVGGNESNSVRHKTIALSAHGYVKQRRSSPFIAIVRRVK